MCVYSLEILKWLIHFNEASVKQRSMSKSIGLSNLGTYVYNNVINYKTTYSDA